jgi:hypothetical protein
MHCNTALMPVVKETISGSVTWNDFAFAVFGKLGSLNRHI